MQFGIHMKFCLPHDSFVMNFCIHLKIRLQMCNAFSYTSENLYTAELWYTAEHLYTAENLYTTEFWYTSELSYTQCPRAEWFF